MRAVLPGCCAAVAFAVLIWAVSNVIKGQHTNQGVAVVCVVAVDGAAGGADAVTPAAQHRGGRTTAGAKDRGHTAAAAASTAAAAAAQAEAAAVAVEAAAPAVLGRGVSASRR